MATRSTGNGRWLRKYKLFFIIGLIILIFQIFLAARFLEINKNQDGWQPQSQDPPVSSPFLKQKPPAPNTTGLYLRLEELDFRPDCQITKKEAISAIHRAKTQTCKQLLANITCQSLAGKLYPKRLQGTCPNRGFTHGKSLGCFKDESNFRLLTGYYGVNKKLNSPAFCTQLCLQSGFQFAGVQYSNECFCGNEDTALSAKLPDSSCNMKCPGDPHATCGGYYTINVYETGIKKFIAQIASTDPPSPEEKSAKIVFLLTLNGRALRQIKRLLKILYHEKHYYYIHVDVREDYLFRELISLEKSFPNIRLKRKRFATIWGGASLLEMLLSCMQDLLNTNWQWDFILNLSESDFPVKQVNSLEQFLSGNRGKNFVKSHGRDPQRFLQKQGLDKTFVECEKRMWRIANRELPDGIQIDGGSDWIALSRPFVQYVASREPDQLVAGLKQVFKYTLLPAESFFHTVLRNSHFCTTYIDNNLHVTNWKRKLGCKCQYKHIVDWCGCSPNDFLPDDWPRIQTTQPRQLYFARKFEPIVNQAILLKLELWLFDRDRPPKPVPNLHAYWQSVYSRADLSPRLDSALFASIARIWARRTGNASCAPQPAAVDEVTSFHRRDAYRATLVRFGGFEVGFKPANATRVRAPGSPVGRRLAELFVSSEFDQKEQMARNFARALSPLAEPALVYRLAGGGAAANVTCLWVDPAGGVADVTEVALEEGEAVGFSKAGLRQPLLAGAWQVSVVHRGEVVAEVGFVVVPGESGGEGGAAPKAVDGYEQFLKSGAEREVLRVESAANVRKMGAELRAWIDELVERFYVIDRVCYEGGMVDVCGVKVGDCFKTNWSSLAPDPKSAIGEVNKSTGMFDIW